MYDKKKFIPFLFAVFIFFALVFSPGIFAQTPSLPSYDVSVSPVFFDLTVNPGDDITNRIRLRNNTDSDLPIKISVKKLSGNLLGTFTLKDTSDDGTLSWIKFQNQTFTARANEWTDIPFTISVPKTAAFGYYWALTFSEDRQGGKSGARLTGAAAVPILLNVKAPGAKAEAKIVEFKPLNYVSEYLPVDFNVKIENTGNVHIKPRGNIFIRGAGNHDLAILDVNSGLGSVLPQSIREFQTSWDDGFLIKEPVPEDAGKPNPRTHIVINWNKLTSFRIGKYTASLLLVFDNGQRDVALETTTTFWVFPYRIIGGTIIGLVLLIFFVRFWIKRYVEQEIRRRSGK